MGFLADDDGKDWLRIRMDRDGNEMRNNNKFFGEAEWRMLEVFLPVSGSQTGGSPLTISFFYFVLRVSLHY